jgi:hypothetical protein
MARAPTRDRAHNQEETTPAIDRNTATRSGRGTRRTPSRPYIDSEYMGIRGSEGVPFAVAVHYPVITLTWHNAAPNMGQNRRWTPLLSAPWWLDARYFLPSSGISFSTKLLKPLSSENSKKVYENPALAKGTVGSTPPP